jgi:hypothetical protein
VLASGTRRLLVRRFAAAWLPLPHVEAWEILRVDAEFVTKQQPSDGISLVDPVNPITGLPTVTPTAASFAQVKGQSSPF